VLAILKSTKKDKNNDIGSPAVRGLTLAMVKK